MKKNKISKHWLIKQKKDPYFRQAKIQGYRSRAVYKLIEMNKKFKIIQKNSLLVDKIDLDYIETLIRKKFLYGKDNETIYILKRDES